MKKRDKEQQQLPQATASHRKTWIDIIAALIVLTIGLALVQRPLILVIRNNSGDFLTSTYRMQEDDFMNPRLQLLRKREKLDSVAAPGKTQFEKIVLLRHWAHSLWKSEGHPFYYPAWDAVEIIDLLRNHGNKGFCAQYAIVFAQACQSMGIHVRYVELWGHFLTGVWSDEYNRWLIMDPTDDIHFEKNSEPLGGRDLLEAYWKKRPAGISKVNADGTKAPVTEDDLKKYRMYSIVTNADQLSNPAVVRVNNGELRKLKREADFRNYPLLGRDNLLIGSSYLAWKDARAKESFTDKPASADSDDFDYPMNQTMLFPARRVPKEGILKVVLLPENSPTFGKFYYQLDDHPWDSTDYRELIWQLHPGMNTMHVRLKTKFGWDGPVSEMSVFYKPPWGFHLSNNHR